jgi:hypothetical protein
MMHPYRLVLGRRTQEKTTFEDRSLLNNMRLYRNSHTENNMVHLQGNDLKDCKLLNPPKLPRPRPKGPKMLMSGPLCIGMYVKLIICTRRENSTRKKVGVWKRLAISRSVRWCVRSFNRCCVTRKEIFGTVTQEETNGCLQMEIPLPFPRELSE